MITTAARSTVNKALATVSKKYGGNITFNLNPQAIGRRIKFTIKVKDSHKAGARHAALSHRRLIAACWHVHGDLFDEIFKLEPYAIIIVGVPQRKVISSHHGNWEDYNAGSTMNRVYASELCHCSDEHNDI